MIINVAKGGHAPKPKGIVGLRAIATVRDGRFICGVMSADRTAFLSDTYLHEPGTPHGAKQEVFSAKDIRIWWPESKEDR